MLRKHHTLIFQQFRGCHSLTSPYLYPDLSPDECTFVQDQVNLVLKPRNILDLEHFDKNIFIPSSRKFLPNVIAVVRKTFPNFKIPKNESDRFVRNLTSIPKLERTVSAISHAVISQDEVYEDPDLILRNPAEIAKWRTIAVLADVETTEASHIAKANSVKGLFAVKYIQDVCGSLEKLGYADVAGEVAKLNFAKYSPLRFVQMERMMQSQFLNSIDSNLAATMLKIRDDSIFAKDLARIVHLWEYLFKAKLDCSVFDIRSFKTLDPLEAIITLTSIEQGLSLKLNDVNPELLWKALIRSSVKFPIGLQIQMLQEIGFSLEETRALMLPSKPLRLSSKSLPITNVNYVSLMREHLTKVRQENPSMSAPELMKCLAGNDFDSELVKKRVIVEKMKASVEN